MSIKSIRKQPTSNDNRVIVYLPAPYPTCPPGLEKLIRSKSLFIRQGLRDPNNGKIVLDRSKLEVFDDSGERIYIVKDITEEFLKFCCHHNKGCGQPFELSMKERHSGYEVFAVNATPDCCGALQCQVSQNGVTLGHITQQIHCCFTHYSILESQGKEIFQVVPPGYATGNVWAPLLDFILCSRDAFEVYSIERNAVIGTVSKSIWHFPQTLSRHRVIFEPIIGLDFPKDLTVTHKALLLGCLFLLEFTHFS